MAKVLIIFAHPRFEQSRAQAALLQYLPRSRIDAYELVEVGVDHIYRESFDTAVRMGVDVLQEMGIRAYTATRAGQLFHQHDEQAMARLVEERHDQKQYIRRVREEIAWQERIIQADQQVDLGANDHAWDSEPMRRGQ